MFLRCIFLAAVNYCYPKQTNKKSQIYFKSPNEMCSWILRVFSVCSFSNHTRKFMNTFLFLIFFCCCLIPYKTVQIFSIHLTYWLQEKDKNVYFVCDHICDSVVRISSGVPWAARRGGGVLCHVCAEERSHQFRPDPGPEWRASLHHDAQHGTKPHPNEKIILSVCSMRAEGLFGLSFFHFHCCSGECGPSIVCNQIWGA